jgi:DNA-binding NtrC family response regulator
VTLSADAIRAASQPLPDNVIASSEEMRELISVVRAVAPTLITVLLIGESGTGKEVFAKLIHDLSSRRSGPFVTVNCGAIPEGLIESELFGHEKGAFTGAVGQRKGFFEAANGGTIFLDEIGEMPLSAQVKLLRVLETGTFTRVGSTTQLKTDARVVAATNRDLESLVRLGTFRTDLYYRLRAVMLRIPPLRNRREDIPFLIEVMLGEFVKKHNLGHMPRIDSDAIQLLIHHEWRGNVRELRNVLEQLVILASSAARDYNRGVVAREDVERALHSSTSTLWQEPMTRSLPLIATPPPTWSKEQSERELLYRALYELKNEIAELREMIRELKETNQKGPREILALPAPGDAKEDLMTLEEIEQKALESALVKFHGNRRQAAEALGISERTLYRKLKEQGIE